MAYTFTATGAAQTLYDIIDRVKGHVFKAINSL